MFRKDNIRLALQKEEERTGKACFRNTRKDSACRKKKKGRERNVSERQKRLPCRKKKKGRKGLF